MKTALMLSLIFLFSCAHQPQFSPDMETKILNDVKRDDITGRLHVLFREMDNQNWKEVREVLHKDVVLNTGNGPQTMAGDDVINFWKENLKNYVSTHHQVSNYGIEVHGKIARMKLVGTITYMGKKNIPSKIQYGSFEIEMIQPQGDDTNWAWEVTKFTFNKRFTENHIKLK